MSIVVASLAPILIVIGALEGLERFRSFADRREEENAGKVINGRVVEGGVVEVMQNKLWQNPDVIILGNSLSNTDIQGPLLAKRLGLQRQQVQKFSVPNSMGAHWYAILKNRVYANGHKPAVVIILSDLQSLLALVPRSEASHLNLAVQLSRYEPVIDELLGSRNYYLERVRENRGKLRDKALISARNLMVDLFYHHTVYAGDDRDTEDALGRVFDSSRTDMRLHNNVIPIFNTQSERDLLPFDPASLPKPDGSFMPRIAALVEQNGGRLVYLRPPMSPLLPDGVGDIVLPETEALVPAAMAEHGGIYLDLRQLDMDITHFHNVDHMNNEGARRFTQIVAELFDDLGLTGKARPSADLLKTVGVDETQQFVELPLSVKFDRPPPALARADRPFAKGRGRLLYFATENLGYLNDAATIELTPHASRCSPIRVLEQGKLLPGANSACEVAARQGKGRSCHTPDKLFFTTSDDTSPYTTDRSYTLALDPDRSCDAALWLYPGDSAKLSMRPVDAGLLSRGAGAVRVVAYDVGSGGVVAPTDAVRTGALGIQVKAANLVRVDEPVAVDSLSERSPVLVLQPRIAPHPGNVTVELTNDSDEFLLITSVRLMSEVPKGT